MDARTQAVAAAVVLAVAAAAFAAEDVTFHVSPAGDDSWSGRSAVPNPGRTDGPFATPGRARDAARAFRKADPDAGAVTVVLAAGRYELTEPLTFTPPDSGTAAGPTRF